MKKILVVDDEPDIIDLVRNRLEQSGYDVITAHDGVQAMDRVEQDHPDLIVMDAKMPHKSGYEVCSTLKNDPNYENIPIIMLSAQVKYVSRKIAFLSGADAYVVKPYGPEALLQQIKMLI